MIGAIGSKSIDDVIIFEVSDSKVLTIDGFKRDNSVRFAKHDVLLKKPVSQYIGPDLDKISFKIMLNAKFGVDPKAEMDKLIYLHRDGEIVSILLGTATFGVYRWRIVSLGMPFEIIDNKGVCISCTLDISFEEYV
jgi:phage protein U